MPRTDIDNKKVVEFYTSGMSIIQIADHFDCSAPLVRDRLLRSKTKLRTHSEAVKTSGMQRRHLKKAKNKPKICSCCLKNPVPAKPVRGVTLTRLCADCYFHAEQDPVWYGSRFYA